MSHRIDARRTGSHNLVNDTLLHDAVIIGEGPAVIRVRLSEKCRDMPGG